MLRAKKENRCVRPPSARMTCADPRLADVASAEGFAKEDFEVQMLYGIQRAEQERLAARLHFHRARRLRQLLYPWFVAGWRNAQRTYGSWCETFSRRRIS